MKSASMRYLPLKWFTICSCLFILAACNGINERQDGTSSEVEASKEASKIESLTAKLLEDPNNASLYVSRALAYSEQGMTALAFKDMERALRVDSTSSYIHATLGELHFQEANLRGARVSLEEAVQYDPENTEALLKLAEVNYLLRRYPEAMMHIDRALLVNERLAKGYFFKGFVFKETGDTTRALSSFQTAVEVNPEYYEAYMELALLNGHLRSELTESYIQTALELRPNSVEAYYHLGLYYQSKGAFEKAIEAYQMLNRADPNAYLGYYNIGYIQLTEYQDFELALSYFDSVLTVQPTVIDAMYNRGLCFEEMGRTQTAVDIYREVLDTDPQYTLAAKGLERLLE